MKQITLKLYLDNKLNLSGCELKIDRKKKLNITEIEAKIIYTVIYEYLIGTNKKELTVKYDRSP